MVSVPTGAPQVISPPSGIPDAPPDTTLIQVGFLYPLNYAFVVSTPMSSAQVFEFLPAGIANGLGLSASDVTMHSLIPYDTSNDLGYITTLALAYIPNSFETTLSNAVKTPLSALYSSTDSSISTMMNYINPAIGIIPGSGLDDGSSTGTSGAKSAATSTASSNNNDIFNTDEQNTTSKVAGTTAGAVVGAVGGAAAYGAAMFFIARRYKKKRASHRRASSLTNPNEMRYTGSPALMGGAPMMSGGRGSAGVMPDGRDSRGSGRTGNSARTAQISAPMMAENSLGWN